MSPEKEKRPDFQRFLQQNAVGGCVPVEVLEDFRTDNGSQEKRAAIDGHLKQCVFCTNRLLELGEIAYLANERGWENAPPHLVDEFMQTVAQKTRKPWVNLQWLTRRRNRPAWGNDPAVEPRALWMFDHIRKNGQLLAPVAVVLLVLLGWGIWAQQAQVYYRENTPRYGVTRPGSFPFAGGRSGRGLRCEQPGETPSFAPPSSPSPFEGEGKTGSDPYLVSQLTEQILDF